jgi:hypothetical protein
MANRELKNVATKEFQTIELKEITAYQKNVYLEVNHNNDILYKEQHADLAKNSHGIFLKGVKKSYLTRDIAAMSAACDLTIQIPSGYFDQAYRFYLPLGNFLEPLGSWVLEIVSQLDDNLPELILSFSSQLRSWLNVSELFLRESYQSQLLHFMRSFSLK